MNATTTKNAPVKAGDITDVIAGDYCSGCGMCAAAAPSISMRFTEDGVYIPRIDAGEDDLETASAVCPFASASPDEDTLGKELYNEEGIQHHPALGYFRRAYAGHVAENEYRSAGSSGGMGNWLLAEALRTRLVDKVINVHPTAPGTYGGRLFAYRIVESPEALEGSGKSRYYPIELSEVIEQLRQVPGRYAVVGIPCFLRSLRALAKVDPIIADRIRFTVGLVCGHLKSSGFGESLAWQVGVNPHDIETIDFRHKLEASPASQYGFMAKSASTGKTRMKPMTEMLGRDWGMGFFKLNACEYCDDVFAETADVTIGDAWLPQYMSDSLGTNIVVTRSRTGEELVASAIAMKRLNLDPLSASMAALSQDSGLRHRRQGLAYRLWLKDRSGDWRPRKRVEPSRKIGILQRAVFRQRLALVRKSHTLFKLAKEKSDLSLFIDGMAPLVRRYKRTYVIVRYVNSLKNRLRLLRR